MDMNLPCAFQSWRFCSYVQLNYACRLSQVIDTVIQVFCMLPDIFIYFCHLNERIVKSPIMRMDLIHFHFCHNCFAYEFWVFITKYRLLIIVLSEKILPFIVRWCPTLSSVILFLLKSVFSKLIQPAQCSNQCLRDVSFVKLLSSTNL